MSKPKAIYNAFYERIKTLEANALVKKVIKTGIEPIAIEDYNAIEVSIGSDQRTELDFEQYEHNLQITADIHVKAANTELDDLMLDVRELIETAIFSESLGLDYIFRINFISQSDPLYNEANGTDYRSATRLEFMIQYLTPREDC